MSIVNIKGLNVSENSYRRARKIVEEKRNNRDEKTEKTADDVLASIREMKPGWTIGTEPNHNWQAGARNIEISQNVLERMAEDPEAMVKFKALILDLEDLVPAIEEWMENNEGQSLEFKFSLEDAGTTRAVALVRGLMGGEVRSTFELPSNSERSWADLIREKLDSMNSGQSEDEFGNKYWQA